MIGAIIMGALLAAAAAPAAPTPPVRLAPVGCVEIPDANVRVPLRVELGARLLDDAAPDPRDFVLLSIACDQSDATLLAVRQGGGTPVRRLVPLGGTAPEARPRALALAAVELLQVADLRDAPPPPPAAAVDKESANAPVEHGPTPTLGVAFVFGSFFASGNYFTTGGAMRFGLELGAPNPPDPTWGFGVAYELMGIGGSSKTVLMNEVLALAQRRGGRFASELGLGARLGAVTESTTSPTGVTTTTFHRGGGPVATVGAHTRLTRWISSDFSMELGYDFRGPGVWMAPQFGITLRF
jgi:hypothetical protein